MARLRLLLLAFAAAVAITLMSSAVRGTYLIDCERDDPSPCVAVARGFPLLYVVDNQSLSPVGSADLLGVILDLDIFIASRFWANVLIWWTAAVALVLGLRRPELQAAAPRA